MVGISKKSSVFAVIDTQEDILCFLEVNKFSKRFALFYRVDIIAGNGIALYIRITLLRGRSTHAASFKQYMSTTVTTV